MLFITRAILNLIFQDQMVSYAVPIYMTRIMHSYIHYTYYAISRAIATLALHWYHIGAAFKSNFIGS